MNALKKAGQKILAKTKALAEKAEAKMVGFATDVSGSDTTEKIGMVVAAIVIVGLLIAAVNQFMPDFFQSILNTAQDTLEGLF